MCRRCRLRWLMKPLAIAYASGFIFFAVNETVFLDFKKREFCYWTYELEVTFLLQIVAGIRV